MKKDEWLKKLYLADAKYVNEADPWRAKQARLKQKTTRKAITAIAACFVFFVAVFSWLFIPYNNTPSSVEAYRDSEYFEIIDKLNTFTYKAPKYKNNYEMLAAFFDDLLSLDAPGGAPEYDNSAGDGADGTSSYQEVTDNQVDGVIEGDLIKRSNTHIYYLDLSSLHANVTLRVYTVEGLDSKLAASFEFSPENRYFTAITEMYLSADCKTVTVVGLSRLPHDAANSTTVMSVDVSDLTDIKVKNELVFSGRYLSSRLTDGKLLLLTKYSPDSSIDFSDPTTFIPSYEDGDGKASVSGNNIVVPEKLTNQSYTSIFMLDESTFEVLDSAAILSYSDIVYVSKENVYATKSYLVVDYDYVWIEDYYNGNYVLQYSATDITPIRYCEGKLSIEETVTVRGYLENQYSLDEYEGMLRVVVTTNARPYFVPDNSTNTQFNSNNGDNTPDGAVSNGDSVSSDEPVSSDVITNGERVVLAPSANLYVFDLESMSLISSVEQFAPQDETVRSVRFDGNIAYVCTSYLVTDPVFMFDLSDPTNITYKDTGTIPGFSTSLINFGEGLLLGIGRGDDFSTVKVEIYAEAEDSVLSVAKMEWIYATYSTEYKSYYINREAKIIGLPLYTQNGYSYVLLRFNGQSIELIKSVPVVDDGYMRMEDMRAIIVDQKLVFHAS